MGRVLARRCGNSATGPVFLFLLLLFILIVFIRAQRGDRYFATEVGQRAQLHSMDAALELFNAEFNHYPPSDANDPAGLPYCGAMRLAEALMGQDLRGFHSDSTFRRDGLNGAGVPLYPPDVNAVPPAFRQANLKARRGPLLPAHNVNAFRLADIYGKGKTGPFPENALVLCDTYARKRPSGKKTGMPILYYRARPGGTTHDVNNPDNSQNIYSYKDNHTLMRLGVPGGPNVVHPLAEPRRFYLNTQRDGIAGPAQPSRKDTFILISAGGDGLYGTADDICNFEWRYHER
jgi:hypothetical protein